MGSWDKMVKVIPLTQGFSTIIDDEDWAKVKHKKWYAGRNRRVNRVYALAQRGHGVGTGVTYLHRLILSGVSGHVVHINGNSLDNRKLNLTQTRNSGCRSKDRVYGGKKPSSKFRGVVCTTSYGKPAVYTDIVFNGKIEFLGRFETEEIAAVVYDHAARLLHTNPRLNFPGFFSERLLRKVEQRLVARGIRPENPLEPQT
jgi:hypothetical protein